MLGRLLILVRCSHRLAGRGGKEEEEEIERVFALYVSRLVSFPCTPRRLPASIYCHVIVLIYSLSLLRLPTPTTIIVSPC